MNRKHDEDSEQRLKLYFFDAGLWGLLPERAKLSLTAAEQTWFSTRFGRVEAALNELRIATEEILSRVFWTPLTEWMTKEPIRNPKLLDFSRIIEELAKKQHEPSLANFGEMLRTQAFRTWLESQTLPKEDRNFILQELPSALRDLGSVRRSAEHGIRRTQQREQVTPYIRRFLGVGCRGVLPHLVQIGKQIGVLK